MTALIPRLASFFERYQTAVCSSIEGSLEQRLAEFFARFGDQQPASRIRAVDTESISLPDRRTLSAFFETIRKHSTQLRGHEAFLDVWNIAGLGRNEVRNAAVLAWLLNPRGSHGQGSEILRQVLEIAGMRVEPEDANCAIVRREHRPLGHHRDRIDLTVEFRAAMVFIEVKVDAIEGNHQLERYSETASDKARVLSQLRGHPVEPKLILLSSGAWDLSHVDIPQIRWTQVASVLRTVAKDATPIAQLLLRSFANHIRRFREVAYVAE